MQDKDTLLQIIKNIEDLEDYSLENDTDTEMIFRLIDDHINLSFMLEYRESSSEGWLQVEYYSEKIKKTIIYNYNVGNFDDLEEVADFIINTEKGIKQLEESIIVA